MSFCQHLSLTASSGSKTALTICQNRVMFQMVQDVAGDNMIFGLRSRVLWYRIARTGEISSAMSRSIRAGIISVPQALLGMCLSSSFLGHWDMGMDG